MRKTEKSIRFAMNRALKHYKSTPITASVISHFSLLHSNTLSLSKLFFFPNYPFPQFLLFLEATFLVYLITQTHGHLDLPVRQSIEAAQIEE